MMWRVAMTQDTENHSAQPGTEAADIRARDLAFAHMFGDDELVWKVGEDYRADGPVWRVDFLRKNPQGSQWMYFRYHYDIPTGVIYFMGARPVDETSFTKLRRQGEVFRPTAEETT
jgi:hypothetical protein